MKPDYFNFYPLKRKHVRLKTSINLILINLSLINKIKLMKPSDFLKEFNVKTLFSLIVLNLNIIVNSFLIYLFFITRISLSVNL